MTKLKINLTQSALIIFFGYAMFADLIDQYAGNILKMIVWFLTLTMFFVSVRNRTAKFNKNAFYVVLLVLMFLFFNNYGLKNGTYMTTVKFIYFGIFSFFISRSPKSFPDCVKYICLFGFVHVLFTFLFYLVPSLYGRMYSVWGKWPSGTGLGKYGYRAALSDHYSGNGMMLALTYLAAFAVLMSAKGNLSKRQRNIYLLLFSLAFFAVILTTKRAHLLFGVMSMLVVYYFCNPEKIHSRGFKIVIAGLLLIPVIYLISLKVPAVNAVLTRFQDLDEDSHMLSRFRMWEIAWNMFLRKPIFGNGWSSFRYAMNSSYLGARYGYMNAHNVYLQLLAETGLAGFFLYMSILIYLIWNSFKLLRICTKKSIREPGLLISLYFSSAFLIFYSLYSFTGNCFYDKMEPFYFAVGGLIIGCKITMKQAHLLDRSIIQPYKNFES